MGEAWTQADQEFSVTDSRLTLGRYVREASTRSVETSQTSDPPSSLGELWSQSFSGEIVSTPYFAGPSSSANVYVIGRKPQQLESTIYALNQGDGAVEWSRTLRGSGAVGPALGFEPGRAVYYSDPSAGEIVAADTEDGSPLWSAPLGPVATLVAPFHVADDSRVYVLTSSSVMAFDDEDGSEEWSLSITPNVIPILNSLYDNGDTSLMHVASNDIENGTGTVTAIDRDSGTEVWSEQRSSSFSFIFGIDDAVYGAFAGGESSGSELVAFDAASGTVRWSDERQDDLIWGFIIPQSDSSLYALASFNSDNTPSQGAATKLDASNGDRIWEYDPGAMPVGGRIGTSNFNVSTRDGRVISVYDDPAAGTPGTEGWSTSLNAGIRDGGLHGSGDVLYTGTISQPGRVYAISASDGSVLDTFDFAGGVSGSMGLLNNRLWVAARPPYTQQSGDSAMYALGGDGGGGGGGGDEWYSEYVNENGVVDTSGLRAGISDWRSGDISTGELRTLIASWRSGDPIDQ